jgi:DNA-binding Lrp family transcriptional regulator
MVKDGKDQDGMNDAKIVSELRKNAKTSIETIAKNCGLSRQKVYRIIKHLEENHIIWGYTAIIDEYEQGLQKFILLLKRTNQPIEKNTVDTIARSRLEHTYLELGVSIESSYYLHGEYDWAMVFTAANLRHAKKFATLLVENYPGLITKMNLMQVLFSGREHHVFNPNPDRLAELL